AQARREGLRDHQGIQRHDRHRLTGTSAHAECSERLLGPPAASACGAEVVGNVNMNRAPPPGRCMAEIWPPWALMMARLIVSPKPAPPTSTSSRPRWNLAKSRSG